MVIKNGWRLRLITTMVAVCVVAPLGATIAAVMDTRPTSVRARDWVSAHASALPNTVTAISEYPIPYRRAIFSALPPAVRSAMWRDQLTQFSQKTSLTPQQRALVEKWLSVLNEKLYSEPQPANGPVSALCKEVAELFPAEQRTVFSVLGPVADTGGGVGQAAWVHLLEGFRQSYVVNAADRLVGRQGVPYCTCNVGPWNCSCGSCGVPNAGCDTSDYGCGCGWLYQCNGQCIAPQPAAEPKSSPARR